MSLNNIGNIPQGNTSALDTEYNFEVVAHRGYDVEAPENTMSAFIEAGEKGYSSVEVDVAWTKDNIPVILHDKTINRTATKENGNPLIIPRYCSDYTYEELLNFDFGLKAGEDYKGEKIPTLGEVLDCSNEYGFDLYIELKKTDDFNEQKAQIIADSIAEAGLEDNVTFISFEEEYLQMMAKEMPEARLGYLNDKKITDETIKTLESLKTDENEVFLDTRADKMNKKASEKLDTAGFEFEAWTVDSLNKAQKMYELGAKGITTDKLLDDDIYKYFNELD